MSDHQKPQPRDSAPQPAHHQRGLILTQPLAPLIDRWVQEHKDEVKEQGGKRA